MTDVLTIRYTDACNTPSDIYEHLPTFVDLVVEFEAKTVIELGTRSGVSTVAWLFGLLRTGGRLWSVDLDPRPEIGDYDHWTFIRGDDCDPETIGQLPTGADIVFIDTSHTHEHTLRELNVYRWMVRPGGAIVLHDTELAHPMGAPRFPAFPVKTAVTEFCEVEGIEWENLPNCFGLGIIRL